MNKHAQITNSPPWGDLQKRLKQNFDAWPAVDSFIPPKEAKKYSDPKEAIVEFMLRGEWKSASCSAFPDRHRNLHALVLAFEAVRKADMRGIAGVFANVAAAFAALPAPDDVDHNTWLRVIGLEGAGHDREEIRTAYREALKRAHPDHGGTAEKFQQVQQAGIELDIT